MYPVILLASNLHYNAYIFRARYIRNGIIQCSKFGPCFILRFQIISFLWYFLDWYFFKIHGYDCQTAMSNSSKQKWNEGKIAHPLISFSNVPTFLLTESNTPLLQVGTQLREKSKKDSYVKEQTKLDYQVLPTLYLPITYILVKIIVNKKLIDFIKTKVLIRKLELPVINPKIYFISFIQVK